MTKTTANTKNAQARYNTEHSVKPLLDAIRLSEAAENLRDLDERFDLIPGHARTALLEDVQDLLAAAEFFDIEYVRDLLDAQSAVLGHLARIPAGSVTQYVTSSIAEPLHRFRNVLLAIAIAGVQSIDPGAAGAASQQGIRLPSRATGGRRPLSDDEIMLLRVRVLVESLRNPTSVRAGVYAMVDAGMTPGETTSARLDDTDDFDAPSQVLAGGNGHIAARHLPLDRFGRTVFGRLTGEKARTGTPTDALLTYRGRKHKPGTEAATASAHGVLDGLLKDLGLFNSDITASSIYLWRIKTVLDHQGVDAATGRSGRSNKEQMYRSLGTTAPIEKKPLDHTESFLDD